MERATAVVLQTRIPVVLAGGLSPENVFDTVSDVLPLGADSCTQTNEVDASGMPVRFKKDFVKVEKFVKEIRRAESGLARQEGRPYAAFGQTQGRTSAQDCGLARPLC